MKELIIYTDGASRGNPGRGGYGAILQWGQHSKELSGGYKLTTNNRMELMAVIAALEALKKESLNIVVYSDSQYVVKAVQEGWLKNWIATQFKGGKKIRIYGRVTQNSHKIIMSVLYGSGDTQTMHLITGVTNWRPRPRMEEIYRTIPGMYKR